MLKGFIRKADIILLIIIVFLGLIASAYVVMSKSSGDTVLIEVDGKLYGKYALSDDRTITIPETAKQDTSASQKTDKTKTRQQDYNVVTIKAGSVTMSSASCHNQVCVKHRSIKSSGESIICLPNKVLVRIDGKGEQKYDSISS